MIKKLRSGEMKAAALALAGRGFKVFPLTARGKEPLSGTHGHLDGTTDPALIERMWQGSTFANIGIHCEVSGILVVDVDMNPWRGKQGRATWTELMARHGHTETFTVRTWSGGLHFYYKVPEGLRLTNTTGKAGGRGLGADIDTRSNGYVVAPPSIVSEDGHTGQYEVVKDLPLADCPDWIIEMVRVAERAPRDPTMAGPVAAEQIVIERLLALHEELKAAPDGMGNATAARVAYMAGQYVGAEQLEQDVAVTVLLEALDDWDWRSKRDERSMQSTIERQVAAGMRSPRAWERAVAANGSVSAPVTNGVVPAAENGAGGREMQDGFLHLPQTVEPVVPDPFEVPEGEPEATEEDTDREVSMWATDNGQGVFLRDKIGNMLYAVGVGWLVWDGKRWRPVPPETVQNRVSRFYREQFERCLREYMATMDSKKNDLAKAYRSFMSSARLGSIMNHLKITDGVLVEAAVLDTHPDLLNVQNGVVNLRTGVLGPHDRKLLMTKVTAAKYEPGHRHPDWDEAQKALPSGVAEFMQLRLGQAITGRMPESDDFIFMAGGGSNGKSSWSSEGVLHAIGDYGKLAQPSLVLKSSEGATPERAGLRGCRYVLIEELPEGRGLSVAEVKRIVGTATITARNLYEKEFTFDATHTLFITTNFMPPIAETDEGSWRRMCKVVFPYEYVSWEPSGPFERKGDGGLKGRIKEGLDGQHEAILAWLVEGAMAYYANPARIMRDARPEEVKTATLEWRKEADRILAFVSDRLDFDPSGVVAKPDLYHEFRRFLETNGHAIWSQETFATRFRAHQMIRNGGITDGQSRNHAELSRPTGSFLPQLPMVPRVFRGLVFRPVT